jgi:meso-butanediol dehydrogenase / (S,S)-butanediol dehydrogenase / diacetyl reductase
MARFIGKVVVITGTGGPGTGGTAARRFAAEGARVVASDIDETGLAELSATVQPGHGGELVTRRTDVTSADDVQALVDFAVSAFGQVDVMVNHAVSMPRRPKGAPAYLLVPEIDPQEWRDSIDGVLHPVFYGCRAAIPELAKTRGCIVNTASISGTGGDYGMSFYDTAKAGVINLTRALAMENGDAGIRVNCVSPSAIAFPSKNRYAQVEEPYLDRVPLRRLATPDDVAGAMLFLASADASYITGHNLLVDGGISAASGQYEFARERRAARAESAG